MSDWTTKVWYEIDSDATRGEYARWVRVTVHYYRGVERLREREAVSAVPR